MADTVGAISLDLIIEKAGFFKQLEAIKKQAEGDLSGSFDKAGDAIGKALSAPVEKAAKIVRQTDEEIQQVVEKSLARVRAQAEEAARYAEAEAAAGPRTAPAGKKGTTATAIMAAEDARRAEALAKATEHAQMAAKAYVAEIAAVSSPVDMLRAKLDGMNAEVDAQLKKIEELAARSNLISSGAASGDLGALDTDIQKAVDKFYQLRTAAEAAREKLDKALTPKTPAIVPTVEKARASVEKTTVSVERLDTAARSAGANGTAAFSGIERSAKKLWNSLKSAAKSALILSVVYKGFRLLREYVSGAMQSNDQFAASLNAVKGNLSIAFQPILDSVLPALNSLMSALATASAYIASFVAGIFGKTYQQAAAGAKKLQKQAAGAGSSAKKALASFDELNIIDDSADGGASSAAGGIDYSALQAPDMSWTDQLKEKLGTAASFFHDKLGGEGVFGTLQNAAIRFLLNMQTTANNIRPVITGVWDSATEAIQRNLPSLEAGTAGFIGYAANTAAATTEVIGGTYSAASKGVSDFYTEHETDVSDLIDRTVDNASVGYEKLGTSMETMSGTVLDNIKTFFDDNSVYVSQAVETTTNQFWNIAQPVIDFFSGVWLDITTAVKEFSEDPALSDFLSAINGLLVELQPAWEWLNETIRACSDIISGGLNVELGAARGLLDGIWQFLKDSLIGQLDRFTNSIKGITLLLKGDWKSAWEEGKKSSIEAIKGIINTFSSFLNIFVHGINGVIEGLNKIKISIPDWVPGFGGRSWGINIAWRMPEIPMLAEGGIVDQPTLSMIGERGKEAVVPLEQNTGWMTALASMIAEAIAAKLGEQESGREIVVRCEGSLAALVRLLKPYFDSETKRRGYKLVMEGV